jgi:hypothetical protein
MSLWSAGDYFSRQQIHIDASITENLDAVMAVNHRTIGSDFERTRFSRPQGLNQHVGRKPAKHLELQIYERRFAM